MLANMPNVGEDSSSKRLQEELRADFDAQADARFADI
jgi:hypothetical protein